MPFSPVEKNWRSQREMIVLENGIQYFQVTEYHYGKDLIRHQFKKYKDAIIKYRDLRKPTDASILDITSCLN